MSEQSDAVHPEFTASTLARSRRAVAVALSALIDKLVKPALLGPDAQSTATLTGYRTPTGCVVQAANSAVSLSWFAEPSTDILFGELHVLLWHGRLAPRGVPSATQRATVVADLVFHPTRNAAGDCQWRSDDGAPYDTARLAAKCFALLEV